MSVSRLGSWAAPWIGIAALVALGAGFVGCASPQPSPSPAASPSSVQVPPNPALVQFEERVADALVEEGQLVRGLADASTGSNDQLGLVARRLSEWAAEELAWLEDHPAETCYAAAADAYRAGLSNVAAAGAALSELAAASAPPTDEEGQAAGQSLATGTESLQEAAALARSMRDACRG